MKNIPKLVNNLSNQENTISQKTCDSCRKHFIHSAASSDRILCFFPFQQDFLETYTFQLKNWNRRRSSIACWHRLLKARRAQPVYKIIWVNALLALGRYVIEEIWHAIYVYRFGAIMTRILKNLWFSEVNRWWWKPKWSQVSGAWSS